MLAEAGKVEKLDDLIRILGNLRSEMLDAVSACKNLLESVHPAQRYSACNLIEYLAFRQKDLRSLQDRLSLLGLSSLGRAEAHVIASVDAVLAILHRLTNGTWEPSETAPVDFLEAERLLVSHADALLGQGEPQVTVRIMVTMPCEAATKYKFVRDLLVGGMDCIRINCAHDDPDTWVRMAENLRRAEKEVGRRCRIHMDLAGLKLRTGKISPRPAVLKARPQRDDRGRVTGRATVLLQASDSDVYDQKPRETRLPVEGAWLRDLRVGDVIRFKDARGANRRLYVNEVSEQGCVGALPKTAYFEPGLVLWDCGPGGKREKALSTKICKFSQRPGFILLRRGDSLIVRGTASPGKPALVDTEGRTLRPAEISCEPAEILKLVSAGDRIWLDDGKIGGKVQDAQQDHLKILITDVRDRGRKLRSEKGINLPDSNIHLPALTDKDCQDLSIVVRYADTVGLSFARTAQDVLDLQENIRRTGDKQPGIILKIETKEAFHELPRLLLAAMRSPNVGVMIARGDLAVECGYERLAEVQEEILWICEAAHAPVVWATEVLDRLAKSGIPSRAEISDAVMAQRAECVMLNKGPFILPAMKVLREIVERMGAHQHKKRAMLRALQIARHFKP
jgi:pyruvate kinase